jgi:hypothetical protein
MKTIVIAWLFVILASSASAQPPKVWTNRDLERPIKVDQVVARRTITDAEMAGIRARAFVAPPVYEPGWSYVIPWKPEDDAPKVRPLPTWSNDHYGQRYAEQPYYPSWLWYPQTRVIVTGRRPLAQHRTRR